jgi:hypothetical protein
MNRFMMRLVAAMLAVSVLSTNVFAAPHQGGGSGHSSKQPASKPAPRPEPQLDHRPHVKPAMKPHVGHGLPKPQQPTAARRPIAPLSSAAHAKNRPSGARSGRTERARLQRPRVVVRPGQLMTGGSGVVVVDGSSAVVDTDAPSAPATTVSSASSNYGAGITAQSADEAIALRYVDVKNDTREAVTFWVQYCTVDDQGQWVWRSTERPLKLEVKAGETRSVRDSQNERIQAAYVRIWAESASGLKWEQFKDTDLPVVGEENPDQTPTFVFTVAGAEK